MSTATTTTTTAFRPMLSAKLNVNTDIEQQLKQLNYPLICSPKIDGIRVLVHPELGPITRSLKPVRNNFVREVLSEHAGGDTKYLDGEIVVGPLCAPDVFNRTTTIMAADSPALNFTFWFFDSFRKPNSPYHERLDEITATATAMALKGSGSGSSSVSLYAEILPHYTVNDYQQLLEYEQVCLYQGFEGIMLRSPYGRYKFNRSTLKEQILIKLKRSTDDEAIIIGFEPLERNQNEAQLNNLGFTERSSHKANMNPQELLGTLIVNHPTFGEFGIGSGFDMAQREHLWAVRDSLINKVITFKYQPTGIKDKPRFPVFLRFKPEE